MGPVAATHTALYRDEHLAIDYEHQVALLDNQRMPLTRKEYDLLSLLVRHAGEIIPRDALLLQVWGYGADIRTRTLDVHGPPAA
ncbi:MAG: winged helix-turn-helix domain-containing protein [Ignavibacteriota bacterium]